MQTLWIAPKLVSTDSPSSSQTILLSFFLLIFNYFRGRTTSKRVIYGVNIVFHIIVCSKIQLNSGVFHLPCVVFSVAQNVDIDIRLALVKLLKQDLDVSTVLKIVVLLFTSQYNIQLTSAISTARYLEHSLSRTIFHFPSFWYKDLYRKIIRYLEPRYLEHSLSRTISISHGGKPALYLELCQIFC